MTPFSAVIGSNMNLWNVGILQQHYTAWQDTRTRLEISAPWKSQNSQYKNQITQTSVGKCPHSSRSTHRKYARRKSQVKLSNRNTCEGVKVQLDASLTSALCGREWSASRQRLLNHRKNRSRYRLDRRLRGPQFQSGRGGEEENSLHFPGIEPRSSTP
jgi:hypothetical protein